jgi:hypothetical protein
VFFESALIDVNKVIARAVFLCGGGIGAPLGEAGHFLWEIELLAAFGFDDPDCALRVADDEIGNVIREVAVGLHVVELEADSEVVLGEGFDVRRGFEEGCEGELEAPGIRLADDAGEDGFPRL